MNILLTGAGGFIGNALLMNLLDDGHHVNAVVRTKNQLIENQLMKVIHVQDVEQKKLWGYELTDIDVVIHVAARAHVMDDKINDPMAEYRRVNTKATAQLAEQASQAGVKRFIFISSAKVNGESTLEGQPFTENDTCNPCDPYAISKWDAEQELQNIAKTSDLELVIIRPPLVYGPEVKGNFEMLVKLVKSRIPLPLGNIYNQRSLVSLDNLIDFIQCCMSHPKAANEVFLISDDQDISTSHLVTKIANSLKLKLFLFSLPDRWIKKGLNLIGKPAIYERLYDSFQVDCSKAKLQLDWRPPVSMKKQLEAMFDNEK